MEKFAINDLELTPNPPAAVQRDLTRPLETCDLALNYYELEPGDAFASAYHHHQIQEELFYVIAGTVTFETTDGPVEVGPGEVVRFPPASISVAPTMARNASWHSARTPRRFVR
jgi:uncharacterized cupin superfamily protein